MSGPTSRVLDVFHVGHLPGPMLFRRASGPADPGDESETRLRGEGTVCGTVFTIGFHRCPRPPPTNWTPASAVP